jgi:dCTP diphosphatase
MTGNTLDELRSELRSLSAKREWDQFHTPKNLAIALSVEASELLEIFQWLTAEESSNLPQEKLSAVREEIGDVLLYLVRLADKLDLDLIAAAEEKIRKNELKYPVAAARGNAKKYTDL